MQAQKNRPMAEKHIGRSKQNHCISIFGLQVEIDRKILVESAIALAMFAGGYAALTIMALAHCAGVI